VAKIKLKEQDRALAFLAKRASGVNMLAERMALNFRLEIHNGLETASPSI
jgi:hypothetical protein